MYLHDTLYERAPHYWISVGILLVILGIYLGTEISATYAFVGVTLGLASCAWGVRILMRRAQQPGDDDVAATSVSAD
jgi:hypothetical protein